MPTDGVEVRGKRTLVTAVRSQVAELSGLPLAEEPAAIASLDGQ
jgi:hypothetical protein